MSKPTQIMNAFTVDVEDYYQVSAFEKHIRRDHWDRWESRVEANTHRILRLLERHGVKATFFVLGWIASTSAIGARDLCLWARDRFARVLAPPYL